MSIETKILCGEQPACEQLGKAAIVESLTMICLGKGHHCSTKKIATSLLVIAGKAWSGKTSQLARGLY